MVARHGETSGRAGFLVGVVGPCSAGKSTLARRLREDGYRVKEIRQEHSAVPDMWRRLTNPTVLIYLDVSMPVAAAREGLERPSSWWVDERVRRLAHARLHCDLYIDTSSLTPDQVYARARAGLGEWDPGSSKRRTS
jgi:chloramphenicol 3-O-phosphotransferase